MVFEVVMNKIIVLSVFLFVSQWLIFCFIMNMKPVISHCLSVLFVIGEHTSCLRKFPTQHFMLMCGLIITLSICRAQVVSQHLQVVNCLCHVHKMNMAVSNFLFAKKEWLEQTKNVLCNVLLVSTESGPFPNFSLLPSLLHVLGWYRPVMYTFTFVMLLSST